MADRPLSRIHFTRHGQSMLNELNRVQGWCDSPLTSSGIATANRLGAGFSLSGIEFQSIYAADMLRHRETATIVLQQLGTRLDIISDPRLREISFGRFEGAPDEEMWSAIASELGYAQKGEAFADPAFDLVTALEAMSRIGTVGELVAERPVEVAQRSLAALTEIAEAHPGDDVLVISSGITIMAVLARLGADLRGLDGGIPNGAVSLLEFGDGRWQVVTVGDLSQVHAG